MFVSPGVDLLRLLLTGCQSLLHPLQLKLQKLILLSQSLILLHTQSIEFLKLLLLLTCSQAAAGPTSSRCPKKLHIPQLLSAIVNFSPELIVLFRQVLSLFSEADRALYHGFQLCDSLLVGEEQRRHHLHVASPRRQGQVVIRAARRRCWSSLLIPPQLACHSLRIIFQFTPFLAHSHELLLELWLRRSRQLRTRIGSCRRLRLLDLRLQQLPLLHKPLQLG
mmetsp:Transcript_11520/g.20396  ORF Transcript_11520/g.20396 Transcript_11520/m.20396 type:complete len:222 (-) Transcript_11520:187-852(-)